MPAPWLNEQGKGVGEHGVLQDHVGVPVSMVQRCPHSNTVMYSSDVPACAHQQQCKENAGATRPGWLMPLQLWVQPVVLIVQLNQQSSEWYCVLDGEVLHALKLTKTYWRKVGGRFVSLTIAYIDYD